MTLESLIESLPTDLNALRGLLVKYEQAVLALESDRANIITLKAERDRYAKTLARQEVDVTDQEKKWDERESLRVEVKSLIAQIHTLESSYDLLQSMFHARVKELEDTRAEVEKLKASRDAHVKRADNAESNLERAEYKISCLTGVGL